MKSTLQKVEEIKRQGYRLDIGEVISQTFENYKKIALLSGAVILLLTLLFFVVGMGIVGVLGLAFSFTDYLTEYSGGGFGATALLVNLAAQTLIYALIAPISAGLLQVAHNAETKREFEFSTAFMHYKTKHFAPLFLATALIILASSGFGILMQISQLYFFDVTLTLVLTFLSIIISLAITILTLLTIPYIIFGDLTAMDAIKASIITVSKRFWIIILLMIVFFICALLGFFAFCIGLFFTLPIFISAQYIIFRNAFPMDEKDELDEIGSSEY
ncbi:putative membrane protein [Flavobacterium arsenatis]|uniref:Membrane protein n=1 Tax=Flavobacterium arsenatis TaxID=1484332 RepID=A0ABU1TTZ7_9FLAO|nr:hypothetical protein [Flavobacterium arsenatis]MDR6969359.1 putative membrane protein [Flavobacterium arsenatis]